MQALDDEVLINLELSSVVLGVGLGLCGWRNAYTTAQHTLGIGGLSDGIGVFTCLTDDGRMRMMMSNEI